MSVVYKKLEEVCEILDSQRIPITAKDRKAGQYPYYGANGLQDYVAEYIFDDELVLLAEDGGNFGSTDRPIAYRVSGKCWVNNHAHVLKAKSCIDIDYLGYSLMFYDTSGLVNGATRQKLTQAAMREMKIPYRNSDEQKEIVKKIDGVFCLIEKRQLELHHLDQLVKSRFVEMFGDPKCNPMHWEQQPLYKILEAGSSVSYGIVQTGDHVQDGVPVFRPSDIADGKIPQRQQLKCTTAEISNQYSRTLLKGYELLITVRGSVGETFQVTDEFKDCNVGRNIVPLRFDTNMVLYPFMQSLFDQEGIKTILSAMTKGIALQGLNMSEFREVDIILPPISLQRDFVAFREQTDKSKLAVKQSLEKLETLKKSLMQQYFG